MLFGVLLLPFIGAVWSVVLVATAYVLLIPGQADVPRTIRVLPFALLLVIPTSLQILRVGPEDRILEFREGIMATAVVVKDGRGDRYLRVNNR